MKSSIKLALPMVLLLGVGTAKADGVFFGFSLRKPGISIHLGIGAPCTVRRRVCVIRRACPPRRVWVPGRYVERTVYVTVPGRWELRWVPPVVKKTLFCGAVTTIVVIPGHWERVWIPPRRVPKKELVFVPGHWRYVRGRIDP